MLEMFQEQLQQQFLKRKKDPIMDPWKQKAWDQFVSLGLPHYKTENFRYVPMKDLYTLNIQQEKKAIAPSDIQKWIEPGFEKGCIVFLNGQFSQKLSSYDDLKGITIQPLTQSFQSFATFQQNHLQNYLKKEKDPFSFLNLALQTQSVFFYVPENMQKKIRMQILCVQTDTNIAPVRIQGFFGKNTNADVIHTSKNLVEDAVFLHTDFDFTLDDHADIRFCSTLLPQVNEWYFSSFRASLKSQANLHAFFTPSHPKVYRQQCHVTLQKESAHAVLSGVWNGKQQNQVHWHTCMEHIAENCTSSQQFRGVLHDESRSSFDGKIYVHPQAQKTDSYQSSRNLVLSSKAKTFVKPNLEIYADDVKASHGATIAQVSEEQLFYLQSRGVTPKQAKKLLVEGFYQEIFNTCPIPSFKPKLIESIQ